MERLVIVRPEQIRSADCSSCHRVKTSPVTLSLAVQVSPALARPGARAALAAPGFGPPQFVGRGQRW